MNEAPKKYKPMHTGKKLFQMGYADGQEEMKIALIKAFNEKAEEKNVVLQKLGHDVPILFLQSEIISIIEQTH